MSNTLCMHDSLIKRSNTDVKIGPDIAVISETRKKLTDSINLEDNILIYVGVTLPQI